MLQEASYSWYYYYRHAEHHPLTARKTSIQNHKPHSTTQQWHGNAQEAQTATSSQEIPAIHLSRVSFASSSLPPDSLFLPDNTTVFCVCYPYAKGRKRSDLSIVKSSLFSCACKESSATQLVPEDRIATCPSGGFRRRFLLFWPVCVLVAAAMDDVKDKMKGFMKKVNNSSSSSGKFKDRGRFLGSSSSGQTNPNHSRPPLYHHPRQLQWRPLLLDCLMSNPHSLRDPRFPMRKNPSIGGNQERNREPGTGFDPFDSLITSSKRSRNGYTLNVVECPICNRGFKSEDEVSEHVDSCVGDGNGSVTVADRPDSSAEGNCDLEACVGAFLSGKPSESSPSALYEGENKHINQEKNSNVVLKLFRNIVPDPENPKFRKIRMSNPKIREAVGDVIGGLELLEIVGFELKEEDGEMWAVMEVPGKDRLDFIGNAIMFLEPKKLEKPTMGGNTVEDKLTAPKSIVRQIKFPVGVVLQGVFAPREPTNALYEFVAIALKDPCLEFEPMHPVVVKRRVIPHWSSPGESLVTLDDEDLVPSALIKFRPIETDAVVFTLLENELLEIIEPLQ